MRLKNQRGMSSAVEAAIVIPVFVTFVMFVVVLANLALAQQDVQAAANQAARAASMERDRARAEAAAHQVVAGYLDNCHDARLEVDTGGFTSSLGAATSVNVALTCEVRPLLALPGLTGTVTVQVSATSPIDSYRSR